MLQYVVILSAVGFASADILDGTRCFPKLECFPNNPTDGPSYRALLPVREPEHVGNTVYLSNSRVTRKQFTIYPDIDEQLLQDFIPGGKTAFIVHGYLNNANFSWIKDMTEALLDRNIVNVIAVDWGKAAFDINYFQAANDVRVMAAVISVLRIELRDRGLVADKDITCIGHSLGAHCCGVFGKNSSGEVGTVVGMDPAGPGFYSGDVNSGLSTLSAKMTIQLDTNAGIFGTTEQVTHLRFLMNGASFQLDCLNILTASPEVRADQIYGPIICSHLIAYTYFTQSLRNPDSFIGYKLANQTDVQDQITKKAMESEAGQRFAELTDGTFVGNLFVELSGSAFVQNFEATAMDFTEYEEDSKGCANRCDCVPLGLETNDFADCAGRTYHIDTSENTADSGLLF